MAQCVYLNPDGTVTATAESPDQCQGFVLLSRPEYASTQTLQAFLAIPTQDQVTAAFNAGVSWPVSMYLVAWAVGTLANFFNKH